MRTIAGALMDECYYPIPKGIVINRCTLRNLDYEAEATADVLKSNDFKGALADCLYSLLTQAVNFSEADKSVSAMSDTQRKALLVYVNKLYNAIGEDEVTLESKPMVHINC